ncbi:MAG: PhoX family protein, partial [Planctomycetia bacterium]
MTSRLDPDDLSSNPSTEPPLAAVVAARFGRRSLLKNVAALAGFGVGATVVGMVLTGREPSGCDAPRAVVPPPIDTPSGSFVDGFTEISHQSPDVEQLALAQEYEATVLVRWGDPVLPGAPKFNPAEVSVDAQKMQFGYNNDYLAFLPLPQGSQDGRRGLLHVNHESTKPALMFPNWDPKAPTREQVLVELAAHGASLVEIERTPQGWRLSPPGKYNRRITGLDTVMELRGPAAGHDRLKTSADPAGKSVVGMLGNCAGGVTPWGTVLTCEENINGYFSSESNPPANPAWKRFGIGPKSLYNPHWAKHVDRFDLAKEPNEPNRFGWIVEYDPYDPASVP